jgi:hypothetical protein
MEVDDTDNYHIVTVAEVCTAINQLKFHKAYRPNDIPS